MKIQAFASLPCLALTALLYVGCGSKPPQASSPTTPISPAPMAEMQKRHEQQKAKAEEERRRQAEKLAHQRSFVGVKFDKINEKGFVIVTLTNNSDKAIDDIRAGVRAEDVEGNVLATSGYTEGVPGDIFLAAGATRSFSPYSFHRKKKLMDALAKDPNAITWSLTAYAITWGDGSKEPGLDR